MQSSAVSTSLTSPAVTANTASLIAQARSARPPAPVAPAVVRKPPAQPTTSPLHSAAKIGEFVDALRADKHFDCVAAQTLCRALAVLDDARGMVHTIALPHNLVFTHRGLSALKSNDSYNWSAPLYKAIGLVDSPSAALSIVQDRLDAILHASHVSALPIAAHPYGTRLMVVRAISRLGELRPHWTLDQKSKPAREDILQSYNRTFFTGTPAPSEPVSARHNGSKNWLSPGADVAMGRLLAWAKEDAVLWSTYEARGEQEKAHRLSLITALKQAPWAKAPAVRNLCKTLSVLNQSSKVRHCLPLEYGILLDADGYCLDTSARSKAKAIEPFDSLEEATLAINRRLGDYARVLRPRALHARALGDRRVIMGVSTPVQKIGKVVGYGASFVVTAGMLLVFFPFAGMAIGEALAERGRTKLALKRERTYWLDIGRSLIEQSHQKFSDSV